MKIYDMATIKKNWKQNTIPGFRTNDFINTPVKVFMGVNTT